MVLKQVDIDFICTFLAFKFTFLTWIYRESFYPQIKQILHKGNQKNWF